MPEFQSAPRLFERGDVGLGPNRAQLAGFNPRPACLSGATLIMVIYVQRLIEVSIRAPLV